MLGAMICVNRGARTVEWHGGRRTAPRATDGYRTAAFNMSADCHSDTKNETDRLDPLVVWPPSPRGHEWINVTVSTSVRMREWGGLAMTRGYNRRRCVIVPSGDYRTTLQKEDMLFSSRQLLLTLICLSLWSPLTASPPAGLFGTLDSNHDNTLSVDEFNNGWPLILKTNSWMPNNIHGGFWKGFTSGVAMILATEIGDKTFFIAAVLSMRQERSAVFCGAILSLYVMTVLSSIMGLVLPALIPIRYTHILGGVLFLYFGVKLLLDSRGMEANRVSEELEEVEEELLHPKKADVESGDVDSEGGDIRKGRSSNSSSNSMKHGFMEVAIQSFTLTFLAEWGDRSQIATIALSAAKNPFGVTLGGCLGHTMCTGLAVLGGRMLAARISEKTVSFAGGLIFLGFGIHSVFFET
jgi:Ca2+/H+ antiporter, TMEM165/GDT1 family